MKLPDVNSDIPFFCLYLGYHNVITVAFFSQFRIHEYTVALVYLHSGIFFTFLLCCYFVSHSYTVLVSFLYCVYSLKDEEEFEISK